MSPVHRAPTLPEAALRILPVVELTPEQLKVMIVNRPGVMLIRGAAGSGKTTTALMRLKQLCASWTTRRTRLQLSDPVRVLVLAYNRTLEGYIHELAKQQVEEAPGLALEVSTFAKFARSLVGDGADDGATSILEGLAWRFGLDPGFVKQEVEYVLGRFRPDDLESYVSAARDGRGTSPRMDGATRRRLLDEVIYPYIAAKAEAGVRDWNDIDVAAGTVAAPKWDVVIVDEAQDFSANQVRSLMMHVAELHSVTFVIDAAQRIYPRSFVWREAGVTIDSSHQLSTNYRNTRQIAQFARGLVEGMSFGDDGTLPDFSATSTEGPLPRVIVGKYSEQVDWALAKVVSNANLADESVAFLHLKGGRWFDYLRSRLDDASVPWVYLARASEWPGGEETVALSTVHSAKGLEFDHVIILGLNQEVTPHGSEEGDASLEMLRRLLAMGIGRARKSVTIGFKPGAASTLVGLFADGTYEKVQL